MASGHPGHRVLAGPLLLAFEARASQEHTIIVLPLDTHVLIQSIDLNTHPSYATAGAHGHHHEPDSQVTCRVATSRP